MFNGSENLPGDYFTYLQQVGGTDYNGPTGNDRTNYFETVPTGALERALFMESDRMGHLLGAVTQGVLDNQRGVVQNEKRQGDSSPGGLVQYALFDNLFPAGHPYRHTVIGSMADLDAASLADVKQWFRDRYGPNNAVLVLAGDVTAAQAQAAGREIFRRDPRRPGQPSGAGGRADAGQAQADRTQGPARLHRAAALLGRARHAEQPARPARHRRFDPRRAFELAPRPDPGARREAGGQRQRRHVPVATRGAVRNQRFGAAGSRPGFGLQAARCDPRRLSRQGSDRRRDRSAR